MGLDYNILLTTAVTACGMLLAGATRNRNEAAFSKETNANFLSFQRSYLGIMCLIYLADWLQGSYQYALYKEMGYSLGQIALFYVIGFGSGGIFGTMFGYLTDSWGRKKGALAFCLIYGISCLTKLFSGLGAAILGRICGGISTSLLYSVFESWMISAHTERGFDASLLPDTFSWASFLNGLVAIFAGMLANTLVEKIGLVAPFLFSGLVVTLASVLIQIMWPENYGIVESTKSKNKNGADKEEKSFIDVVNLIFSEPQILAVGIIQCCFESSMYLFIFLWGPVIEKTSTTTPPYGLIFSLFMVCIMIGSQIFKLLPKTPGISLATLSIIFTICTIFFSLPAIVDAPTEKLAILSFCIFEVSCGVFYPTISSLRAVVIKESRAAVMSIFRIPLNAVVVGVLLSVDGLTDAQRFGACAALMGIGMAVCTYLNLKVRVKVAVKKARTKKSKDKGVNQVTMGGSLPITRSRAARSKNMEL